MEMNYSTLFLRRPCPRETKYLEPTCWGLLRPTLQEGFDSFPGSPRFHMREEKYQLAHFSNPVPLYG